MNQLIEFENLLGERELSFRVRLILGHARCNLRTNLSLSELAAISNVCVSHVCHLFKAELRMSPGRCIKLLRLRSAAQLLATTSLSVKQVMAGAQLRRVAQLTVNSFLLIASFALIAVAAYK